MKYFYNPPSLIKFFNKDFYWNTSNNKILLTFDDGPTESSTSKILSILRAENLKSVFFCVGNNIKNYLSLAEKILKDGHVIASHSMYHKLLIKMSREELKRDILTFNNLMKEKFNYDVKYFRPPYGRFNLSTKSILKQLNLKCVMWTLLTYDYKNNFDEVKYGVDNYLRKNSIIVFHDNIKCSGVIEKSLDYTIEYASKIGYEFGEPDDCLK